MLYTNWWHFGMRRNFQTWSALREEDWTFFLRSVLTPLWWNPARTSMGFARSILLTSNSHILRRIIRDDAKTTKTKKKDDVLCQQHGKCWGWQFFFFFFLSFFFLLLTVDSRWQLHRSWGREGGRRGTHKRVIIYIWKNGVVYRSTREETVVCVCGNVRFQFRNTNATAKLSHPVTQPPTYRQLSAVEKKRIKKKS